ncbi:MAG TPA: CocE/NonD family hydrolase [Solirubrobacteraceae bacterium]|nr:CocE/NonD family hydrolase [Solirubrobacteraceae bacterium]
MRRGTWALAAALMALAALMTATAAAQARGRAAFRAHGSVQQVYAVGLGARERVVLLSRRGTTVATQRADSLGGIVFRNVVPGRGYRLRAGGARSGPLTVLPDRSVPPSTRIYDQRLPAGGYGYLTTRDGTSLAIDVRLPGPAADGPYPTLVEYAGYGYADPAGAQSGISPIATLLGFAVVDVNMRGTGCSGGSFDFFEPLQSLDGYDVIETVARQPWVLGHRVGMLGISYGGISQLFVGATDPPHLAAIAPLSVFDSTATTLYPGGILNTGFAVAWAQGRQHDALPASPTGGQAWAYQRIRAGDRACRANQVLHGEAPNVLGQIRANAYFVPSVANPLDPVTFVHRIHVPVYLACQWTDEQTGAHCADLAQDFTGTRRKWFTFTNGDHVDSLDPATFDRWYDFLELYVAHRAPHLSSTVQAEAPTLFQAAIGVPGVTLPPDPIQSQPSYAAALAAFQRLAPVRVLFDNGAGSATPGAPYPAFEQSFARFPIPGTRAESWYLGAGGALTTSRPAAAGADRFAWNPRARPATSFTGPDDGSPGGLWTTTPTYHWDDNPAGTAASYVTAPLAANTVVIGGGSVQLWIKASAPSVDLQATVSEVRPDGKETFVQDGWVRAGERSLAAGSTLLEPVLSLRRAAAAPLPSGRYALVTVPLYYEGHAYRAGSRIRVTVAAPGGDQPVWAFAQPSPRGTAHVTIAHSSRYPSRLVLPVVPGVAVPTGLPPCPGLRGEACRGYVPYHDDAVALG